MLLEDDGLDKEWENGVQSSWEGRLGLHDLQDTIDHVPNAIARLLSPSERRAYDCSRIGVAHFDDDNDANRREIVREQMNQEQQQHARNKARLTECDRAYEKQNRRQQNNEPHILNRMSLGYFRSKLIQHFAIAFQKNKIVWPGRRNRLEQQHL